MILEIKELLLKIPNMDKEQGRVLANRVSQKLAAHLPDGLAPQTIADINIRLTDTTNLNHQQLADRIVDAIWNNIQQQVK